MSHGHTGSATPAIAALVAAGVWHKVYDYHQDDEADSFGHEAVSKLGVEPERLYKTLVVETHDRRLANAVVAVADQLDFKKLARALSVKAVHLAEATAAQRKTGYVTGGIAPLGQKDRLPTIVDASVRQHETILVSAGRRGLSVELHVDDLLNLSRGTIATIRR